MTTPLHGIRVLSVEQAVAIPLCSRHLSDLGADVVKVEHPAGGDFARRYDDYVHGWSSSFVWLNRGKRSVALDLKSESGREAFTRLAAQADVLLCNLAPGALERMVSDDQLKRLNPRLIRCYLSGYGPDGPGADKKAYDLIIQAEAGAIAVTGSEDEPAKIGISVADIAGGSYALSSVLAALYARNESGQGRRIDISLFESLLEWMSPFLIAQRYTGVEPPRSGRHHSSIVPYGPFRTSDGDEVFIAVQNEGQWQRLCADVLDDPQLAHAAGCATAVERVANRDLVNKVVADRLATLSLDAAIDLLARADVPHGIMNDLDGVWDSDFTQARRATGYLPTGEEFEYLLAPFERASSGMRSVPLLGEHTSEVMAQWAHD